MRLYETGIIFDSQIEEAEYEDQIKKISDLIQSNSGQMQKVDRWGIRRLAFAIKKRTQGYYAFFYYDAPAQLPRTLEAWLRINEKVLRFMTIVSESQPAAEKKLAPEADAAARPDVPPAASEPERSEF